jgi:hypothetical protein
MNRETEASLLEFCARQREEFEAAAWLDREPQDRDELAVVALFLAGVDWFGHRRELLEVAERLHHGGEGRFSELARSTQFDCSRFSNLLRRRLTHAHAPS